MNTTSKELFERSSSHSLRKRYLRSRFTCVVCDGTGISPGESPSHKRDCPNCKGEGTVEQTKYVSTSTYHMR